MNYKMPETIFPTPAELAACGPRTTFVSAAGLHGLYATRIHCAKCGEDNLNLYHSKPLPSRIKILRAVCGFCR